MTAAAIGARWREATASEQFARVRDTFVRFGPPVISLAVLFGALVALRRIDMGAVLAMMPSDPLFWIAFAVLYASPIATDWLIYRRLWGLPAAGAGACARKLIGNELVIGYIGEAYLYAWGQRQGVIGAGAIRQVKDVSILSAVAGNTTTLVVAALAAPFVGMLGVHLPLWAVIGSALGIASTPLAALFLRGRLFSIGGSDLGFAMAAHSARAIGCVLLNALLWHLVLPQVALVWWLLFSAIKQVVSRVPFLSNKDVVLAGLSALLFGKDADVTSLLALIATLMVSTHVLVGLALAAKDAIDGMLRRVGGLQPAIEEPALVYSPGR